MDSPSRRFRLRLWLAVLLLIIGLLVIILSALPETRFEQVLPMPPVSLPTPTAFSLSLGWERL